MKTLANRVGVKGELIKEWKWSTTPLGPPFLGHSHIRKTFRHTNDNTIYIKSLAHARGGTWEPTRRYCVHERERWGNKQRWQVQQPIICRRGRAGCRLEWRGEKIMRHVRTSDFRVLPRAVTLTMCHITTDSTLPFTSAFPSPSLLLFVHFISSHLSFLHIFVSWTLLLLTARMYLLPFFSSTFLWFLICPKCFPL